VAIEFYKAHRTGDFPWLRQHVPVLSEAAWRRLAPLIGASVEALPLASPDGPYYAINVLRVLDCLDRERSDIDHFPSGGISWVDRYALRPDCVGEHPIFKLSGLELKEVFVSEAFKRVVDDSDLTGFVFTRIDQEPSSPTSPPVVA
jgi:hypothetical protein